MTDSTRSTSMKRRNFFATTGAAAAAASVTGLTGSACNSTQDSAADVEWRNRQPGMAYRRFGRTNMMISEIVPGGLRINDDNWRILEKGIEQGINYLDTAGEYGRGKSEQAVSHLIDTSSKRERVFVATEASITRRVRAQYCNAIYAKLSDLERFRVDAAVRDYIQEQEIMVDRYLGWYGNWQEEQVQSDVRHTVTETLFPDRVTAENHREYRAFMIEQCEESLGRLKTDYVDVLMCPHAATGVESAVHPDLMEAAYQLKKDGKIRYFGVSAHNNPAGILRAVADSEVHDMAMVAYNVGNAPWMDPALEYAGQKDLGVIAMKVARAVFPNRTHEEREPLPGIVEELNRLIPRDDLHIAQKAYVQALRNPNVHACVSEIIDEQLMADNAGVAGLKV